MTEENRKGELCVTEACPKEWNELVEAGDATRFCGECQLHVHDSTALTRAEAQQLVQSSEGRVCMRIVQDKDGQTLFRDADFKETSGEGEQTRPSPWGPLTRLTLAAGAGLLTACQGEQPLPPDDDEPCDIENPVSTELLGRTALTEDLRGMLGGVGYIEVMGEVASPAETEDPEAVVECPEILGSIAIKLPVEPESTEEN